MRFVRLVIILALTLGPLALPLVAQEPVGEFQPVAPGELQEQLPAAPLVFGAYAFVWTVFIVYLFLLWQRMKRVESDLTDVRAKLGGQRR